MEQAEVMSHARALYAAHGDRAEYEAQQKAKEFEAAGERDTAEDWTRIRAAIRTMRGATQG